jgi:pSer/pThr/pTyr-binding forkhead associated (FHA) protein
MKFGFSIYRSGERVESFLMIRNPSVIGRSEDCDVVLESRSVSRRHAELKLKREGMTIKDLGSRNGTLVNGKLIKPDFRVLVNPGDTIQIGKFTLQIEAASEKAERPPKAPKERSTDHDDLLESLELFIRDRTVHHGRIEADMERNAELANSDTWEPESSVSTGSSHQEPVLETRNDETQLLENTPPTSEVVPALEKVTLADDGDKLVDEAELRRLDLRKRLDAMKAKDSKEAADRALKKLFGG